MSGTSQVAPTVKRTSLTSTASIAIACWLACSVALVGCKKDRDDAKRLPPATDWSDSSGEPGAAPGATRAPAVDPHAGVAGAPSIGADPHAGMDMSGVGGVPNAGVPGMGGAGGDPHAGLDMSGAGGAPHAGMPGMGGTGMSDMDSAEPNPHAGGANAAFDESKYVKGTIVSTDKTKALIKPGAIIFLSAKIAGQTSSLAVHRVDVTSLPMPFHLPIGVSVPGEVVISARVDTDGEARSRSPGDIEGSVASKIPAENLELKLDTVLR